MYVAGGTAACWPGVGMVTGKAGAPCVFHPVSTDLTSDILPEPGGQVHSGAMSGKPAWTDAQGDSTAREGIIHLHV